jgi:transcriptional regulator with XRE-family HTH domain
MTHLNHARRIAPNAIITSARELKARATAVGLTLKSLAERTGVDASTISRISPATRHDTVRKLTEEVEREERKRLAELLRLHGQQAA